MSTKAYVGVTINTLDSEHCSRECAWFRAAAQGVPDDTCLLPGSVLGVMPLDYTLESEGGGKVPRRTRPCIEAERRAQFIADATEACPPEEPKAPPPDPFAEWRTRYNVSEVRESDTQPPTLRLSHESAHLTMDQACGESDFAGYLFEHVDRKGKYEWHEAPVRRPSCVGIVPEIQRPVAVLFKKEPRK